MSDPVSNADIEDVLSSIRRLVSDKPGRATRRPASQEAPVERFVLTPAFRVRGEDAAAAPGDGAEDVAPEPQVDLAFEAEEEWQDPDAAADAAPGDDTHATGEADAEPHGGPLDLSGWERTGDEPLHGDDGNQPAGEAAMPAEDQASDHVDDRDDAPEQSAAFGNVFVRHRDGHPQEAAETGQAGDRSDDWGGIDFAEHDTGHDTGQAPEPAAADDGIGRAEHDVQEAPDEAQLSGVDAPDPDPDEAEVAALVASELQRPAEGDADADGTGLADTRPEDSGPAAAEPDAPARAGPAAEPTLEQRIAELEAALRRKPQEWEPDGSEGPDSDETRPLSMDAGEGHHDLAAAIASVAQETAEQVGARWAAEDGAADEHDEDAAQQTADPDTGYSATDEPGAPPSADGEDELSMMETPEPDAIAARSVTPDDADGLDEDRDGSAIAEAEHGADPDEAQAIADPDEDDQGPADHAATGEAAPEERASLWTHADTPAETAEHRVEDGDRPVADDPMQALYAVGDDEDDAFDEIGDGDDGDDGSAAWEDADYVDLSGDAPMVEVPDGAEDRARDFAEDGRENAFADDEAATLDEEALRLLVADLVREELQGVLGERITRNVRRLVRREIQRALTMRDLD